MFLTTIVYSIACLGCFGSSGSKIKLECEEFASIRGILFYSDTFLINKPIKYLKNLKLLYSRLSIEKSNGMYTFTLVDESTKGILKRQVLPESTKTFAAEWHTNNGQVDHQMSCALE